MNTYYKLSLLYLLLGAFFLIIGFYATHDMENLKKFYKKPYIVDNEGDGNAREDGEIA